MEGLLVAGAMLAALGLGLGVFFLTGERRILRRLHSLPVVPVRDAADGKLVRITGVVRLMNEPLTAPLSGRPCTYFLATAEERADRAGGISVREEEGRDFLVEDETGSAVVRFAGAKVVVDKDRETTSGGITEGKATSEQESFLERHGQKSHGWVLDKWVKYTEGVIQWGERVTVCGMAHREPDPDPKNASGYREVATRLVLRAHPKVPLLITDLRELT